ncbi:PKD domain-containing protein [Chryseobacterium sp. CCH4-E10]|uniref:PKD domain-containing protein n=1 Tax=Chryseobacterium sp. CCH4-E10 TaxID=1768758 RepID=UPI000831D19F|nr:PKD domain-containing protein [Chryseobacterium sp. CCH4-E10]
MNTKLDNVTTQYRKFNVNQVLTEGQLNEFIDYFEDQDRLSRTHLSGVGVVCGFKSIYFDASVTKDTVKQIFKIEEDDIDLKDYIDTIAITQGTGVTTDGDLITLRQKTLKIIPDSDKKFVETAIDFKANAYKYYRIYEDAQDYKHFIINKTPINLLEIITQQDYDFLVAQGISVSNFKPVKEIEKLNEKIVILYLESYSNEESPCQDADCDNAGSEQVSNLRVLLADQNEIENIIEESDAKDTLYQLRNVYEDLFKDLHNIEAKRVILNPGISTASQLKSKFIDAINAVSELSEGFTRIAEVFNVSLNVGSPLLTKLNSLLYSASVGTDNYQYRYDLLKDLIDTHNEIRSLVLHLHAECCPSISSFPKHLLLGPLGAKLELGENTPLRHGFYHSPITTGDDENYEMIVMLANRFVQKVNGFRAYSGPVKITPSHLNVHLGDKAIPYYYNVDQSLLSKWNYEKTKTDRETYNLSYHTANLAGEDFIQNPLDYNLDDHDFYRIEGHLGLPFETAVQNINDLKAKYGLAFDVTVLLLNNNKIINGELEEPRKVSIPELRAQVLSISNDISKATGDSKSTLQNLTKLDSQLKLLNKAKFDFDPESAEEVTIVKEDPKKKEIATELLKDFLERKSGLEHMAGVRPGDTFVLIAESETNNLVLADFTLPYLCCSKKDPVFLVLPASQLCQNDAPVPMTIVPVDGEVKAFVNGTTPVPAITQSGGQNLFNPGLVNPAYFGKEITFTVNDDPVETKMVVHAVPVVTVTTGEVVYGENVNAPEATVTFNITGHQPGFTYNWDFDDNSTDNPVPVNNVVTHKYFLGAAGTEDVYRPKVTVKNGDGCSITYNINPITLKLVINKNTKIYIYFDSSGSMNSTLSPLQIMRDNLLKNRLLPLYGNDGAAYDNNVKVISNGNERTFEFLNMQGQSAPEGNVIVLVFQDEANSIYHSNSINNRTTAFSADIQALKTRIANNFGTNNPNYYRGVVFQVDGDGVFRQLMSAVETGSHASYPSQYNLQSEVSTGKVIFKYDVPDGDTPANYLDRVIAALQQLGYNIP